MIASECGWGSVLINGLFVVLLGCGSAEEFTVLTFLQAFNSFPAGGSIILFFNFLNPQIGFAGLEFRVTVDVREIVAFTGDVGLLVSYV